jgi:hypothetical protein
VCGDLSVLVAEEHLTVLFVDTGGAKTVPEGVPQVMDSQSR